MAASMKICYRLSSFPCHIASNSRTGLFQRRHQSTVFENRVNDDQSTSLLTTSIEKTLQRPDYFGVSSLFTVEDLFKARVHLGHKKGLRNDYMAPYIYGERLGSDIIDLDQTAEHMELALNVSAHIAYRQGIILFICRNRQHALTVENTAKECQEYAHCRYWSGGLFTNSAVQYKSVTRHPDLCIFMGTQNNVFGQHRAVNEAAKLLIATIGVVDTNSDPRLLTYPIPGNDDSPSAISLYCNLFKKAINIGKERRKKDFGEV